MPTRAVPVALAAFIFLYSWLFRFNDPSGSFAGLTDDHFFYLVRGWQILFGDLPVRDFVDHGAPLYYYVAAAVQWVGGRGTLSELLFSVTVLSAAAVLTWALAVRASGSLLLGTAAVLVHVFLEPRFYNYPKVLVYAAGIPLVWWFIDRPSWRRGLAVAGLTAIAALFRHDHGVFLALAMFVALVSLPGVAWGGRLRQAAAYAVFVLLLLAPYALFIQANGGIGAYLTQAAAWAERDRERTEIVWPGLLDFPQGPSEETVDATGITRAVAVMRDNRVAWLYYLEIALPFLAALVLMLSPAAFRPAWPHAARKIAVVIVLGIALNAGFLRTPLEARLADPSVPHAILIAWLVAAAIAAVRRPAAVLRPALAQWPRVTAAPVVSAVAAVVAILSITLSHNLYDRLDSSSLVERPGKPYEDAAGVYRMIAERWPLERWSTPDDEGPLRLAHYLRRCTRSTDRVLMQHYLPQVLALAERGFAGGHADLRPGFFATEEAQRLTIARLMQQSVPVVVLDTGESLRHFRASFPMVTAYLDERYREAGDRPLGDDRFSVHVLVDKQRQPSGHFAPLDLPCFN